jgi:hypothetical protein
MRDADSLAAMKRFLCGERRDDEPSVPDLKRRLIREYEANAAALREELGEEAESLRLKRRVEGLESENERLRDAAKVAAVELDFIVNTKGMRGGMYEAAYYKLKDALSPQEKP